MPLGTNCSSVHPLEGTWESLNKSKYKTKLKIWTRNYRPKVLHTHTHTHTHTRPRAHTHTHTSGHQFSSVQSLSCVRLFATPWIAARQASLSITNSRSSLRPRPSSPWCNPAISSSVVPFSSWPQSLPASGSFLMSQLFTWDAPPLPCLLKSFAKFWGVLGY